MVAHDLAVEANPPDQSRDAKKMSSSSVNTVYSATAVIELGAGLALLCFPSTTVALLLGRPLEALPALTVARVGGTGLLTLGVACWLARSDTQSRAARGLIAAMVLYNLGVVFILGAAGMQSLPVGVVLSPVFADMDRRR